MPVTVPATLVVAAVLAAAPVDEPTRSFDTEGLDAAAVEQGLRARIGDSLDGWSIEVSPAGTQRYAIELRSPDGSTDTRVVELVGGTDEDRSRELASTLALIIEEAQRAAPKDGPKPDGDPSDPAKLDLPLGFLVVEAHTSLGPPNKLDPNFGLGLAGGAWLVRDHLQPRAAIRWSHSWSGDLTVHQISGRLGVAVGAPIGHFWVGALVMPAVGWTRAHQIGTASTWTAGGEGSAMAQYRRDWLVIGLRTGVETTFPAPRAIGTNGFIRWGHLRWLLVLELGIGLPGPPRAPRR